MSEISTDSHREAGRYEIRLKGHLGSRWAEWFDGLSLSNESDGTTLISALWPTKPRFMACCRRCATSAYPWSRSPRSTLTTPTYPPSHLDRCSTKGETT